MDNRIEILRNYIDKSVKNKEPGSFWFVERHTAIVSSFSAMLAKKRALNTEIATMIGLLHDIHTLLADDPYNHAELGSLKAKEILSELNIVSSEELEIISTAIKNHSSKTSINDDYSELIKDADVLSHYFHDISLPIAKKEKERLEKLLDELDLGEI